MVISDDRFLIADFEEQELSEQTNREIAEYLATHFPLPEIDEMLNTPGERASL